MTEALDPQTRAHILCNRLLDHIGLQGNKFDLPITDQYFVPDSSSKHVDIWNSITCIDNLSLIQHVDFISFSMIRNEKGFRSQLNVKLLDLEDFI